MVVRIGLDPTCDSPAARAYLILLRFKEIDPEVRSAPSETDIRQGVPVTQLDLIVHDASREVVQDVYETLTEVVSLGFPEDEAASIQAVAPQQPLTGPPPEPAAPQSPPDAEASRLRLPESVQAPIQVLDEFVAILGEMTVARSHLEDTARALGSAILHEEVDRLGKLVRAFHERVMSLRMLPLSLITGNLKRLVRDHAGALGKEVDLKISGEEIGMDKSILLQLSAPLAHLIRNALDHGLETPEERRQRGRPPRGCIEITASRARNRVEIKVSDDGRGVDVEAVRRKAVAAELYREEESRGLAPHEILSCLFRPGFTTRSTVTALSGRGVGLDVVKSNVDAVGGTIEIRTNPGGGTRFLLSLPLSVAIVPVLVVEVGGSVLALPTASVIRTVEAQPGDVRESEGEPVLLTEQGQVPILGLGPTLGLHGQQPLERVPLALVQANGEVTALAVDRFLREEDLFIKPLKGPLKSLQGLSGYSVLGDGRLVFLLDPQTLVGE
jgi:two-component system chemotaxis sensor kinase CheA